VFWVFALLHARRLAVRAAWCRSLAHLMRVGLPICVLAKEVMEIANHLASGVVERRHHAVATRHVSREKRQWSFFRYSYSDSYSVAVVVIAVAVLS
jgi:hypothetical protein